MWQEYVRSLFVKDVENIQRDGLSKCYNDINWNYIFNIFAVIPFTFLLLEHKPWLCQLLTFCHPDFQPRSGYRIHFRLSKQYNPIILSRSKTFFYPEFRNFFPGHIWLLHKHIISDVSFSPCLCATKFTYSCRCWRQYLTASSFLSVFFIKPCEYL